MLHCVGAERPYVLRDNIRAPKIEQEFIFPHGSLLALGPETNANFYHSVRQLKKEEETGDVRISITFRKVATFRSEDGKVGHCDGKDCGKLEKQRQKGKREGKGGHFQIT